MAYTGGSDVGSAGVGGAVIGTLEGYGDADYKVAFTGNLVVYIDKHQRKDVTSFKMKNGSKKETGGTS